MIFICNQAAAFFYSILGGMLAAFVYDIFRVKRKIIKTNNHIVFFEDFFYWIICAIIVFAMVYLGNNGEVRGYIILGAVIGAVLYSLALSKIIMTIFLRIVKIVKEILVIIYKIVSYPVKLLIVVFRPVFRGIMKIFSKIIRNTKVIVRPRLANFAMLRRMLGNSVKKI